MAQVQWVMKSEVGPLFLVANESGLQGVFWEKQNIVFVDDLEEASAEARFLTRAVHQLEEYFSGKRSQFDLPLEIEGTDFQKKVWRGLAQIPYGETLSYKDLAKKIGTPGAYRAVGTANGRNPFSLIIPCHRVIAADGTLGGYAGGLPLKARLLELEKSRATAPC